MREPALQTPRSVQKEGRRCSGAEIPLQPVVMKTMVRQAVPLQPREVHRGADLHLQPWERRPHTVAGGCLKMAVIPWGSPRWSRLLAGPVAPWSKEAMWEQVFWQDL